MSLDIGSLSPSQLAPTSRKGSLKPGNHFVQLYDDDPSLLSAVRAFFANGLRIGDAAICIAAGDHLAAFEAALSNDGLDVGSAIQNDAYIPVDANEALEAVSRDGLPDQALFSAFVGDLILRAANSGRHVRIFGEIVALMWAAGNSHGAVRLEELWNDLAEVYPFQLFCAYPVHAFTAADADALSEMCAKHTHVLPPR